jgi:type IV pilus assembly protein PilB
MAERRLRLGDILVQAKLITEEHLAEALEKQKKDDKGESLGIILVKLGHITEKDLILTLSKQLGVPYASNEKGTLTPKKAQDLQKRITEEFARKNSVLPLSYLEGSLTVAMSDPLDIVAIDNIKMISGCTNVNRVIASRGDIDAAIKIFYGEGEMLKKAVEDTYKATEVGGSETVGDAVSLDTLVETAETGPVIKMTDLLLREAIKGGASDIHVEPFRNSINIRYRIDGRLREIKPPAKHMALPIVSRIKILSNMDIAEKRLPQDGSFTASIENRMIDFRVSTLPTVFGEKVVMRILDRSRISLSLETLGFEKVELESFKKAIQKPHGLILVTGPTGSGKTTTLYSALNQLKTPDRNIMTVEDPVEYQIDGINQVEARASIGLTFAAALRSFLRQDPDVILVGEIRDLETAQICIRAALTGHVVFSTLHTNDASSAVSRLSDIGIEPFFVASSLLMIVAQRLLRKLCLECKVPMDESTSKLLPAQFRSLKGSFFQAKGCSKCNNTGYSGRTAIYEILMKNHEIEGIVSKKGSAAEIRQAARNGGMKTLMESGLKAAAEGITSLEEVQSVTMIEE